MIRIFAIALLALWLAAPAVLSLADENRGHVCFRVVDGNHDGRVTLDEFAVVYGQDAEPFRQADVDGDGTLTHDEYHAFLGHGAS